MLRHRVRRYEPDSENRRFLVIVFAAFFLWQSARTTPNNHPVPEISYSQFISQVSDGQIAKVTTAGDVVHVYDKQGASFKVIAPQDHSAMLQTLRQHGVQTWFKEGPEQSWATWLQSLAPIAVLAVLWFFMIRQLRKRQTGIPPGSAPPPENPTRFGA